MSVCTYHVCTYVFVCVFYVLVCVCNVYVSVYVCM